MSTYTPTIGLEVHVELDTKTKMFCNSRNDASETRPNVNICPVCMSHPGTLPVINKEAVRHVLRVGIALGAKLADYTEFDRKNYFYPDLPKGYQLSQYEFPLVAGGMLKDVAITRVHLEEDTASSVHNDLGETSIDYNRAGVPLMELVTEPVIHSAKQAGDFGRELQILLRYLGASEADMEKGQMRLEANISVSRDDSLGTKVEVKNINSFRAMERAIEYEVKRQSDILEAGGQVYQETRGWDDSKQATFSQRIKEGSADYRYFPDPDLPSLKLSEIPELSLSTLRDTLPELPRARRERYTALGIKASDADQFVAYPILGTFLDDVLKSKTGDASFAQLAANYIANDLVNIIRDFEKRDTENKHDIPISVTNFSTIVSMIQEKKVSSRAAKDLLIYVIEEGKEPELLAQERGLLMNQSGADIESTVLSILAQNPSVVDDYKKGKEAALQFLLGQGMRILKGAVDPAKLKETFLSKLS